MATRLTYGSLTIDSSELISFNFTREFRINNVETIQLLEITQPGNLTPIEFTVSVRFTDDADTKFNNWQSKLAQKSLEPLTFLLYSWGNFYLSSLNINGDELDDYGNILRLNMDIKFIQNQNFG